MLRRAWWWTTVACALICGGTVARAQQALPDNPLRKNLLAASTTEADRRWEIDDSAFASAAAAPIQPMSSGGQRRSVLARQPRKFSDQEVWGEEMVDPHVQAALAIQELPSPEATIGLSFDDPLSARSEPPLPPSEPSAGLPRIGFPPPQEMPLEEAWPVVDGKLPPGAHYSPEGLAVWWRWQRPWLGHADPNDPHRHAGVGQPLEGTSWRNRPWFAGAFFGGAFHGDLTDNVRQNNGSLLGLRLGWDLDHYYGIEGRYAFSNPQIMDGAGNSLGDSHDYLLDASALYYPFGDARWRPYLGLGLGIATYRFRDERNERIHDSALSLPISAGVKYFYAPHFTLRLDAVDNITFGSSNIDAMNHFFLLGSVEYRFGGRKPSYFPWQGGTAW